MNIEKSKLLEAFILQMVPQDRTPTEDEVYENARRLQNATGTTDEELEVAVRNVKAKRQITMQLGTALTSAEFRPWLDSKKPDIDPYYSERFHQYLIASGWVPQVVRTLDRVTDEILDLAGDPMEGGFSQRRGLVMGDVQSGKTSTYTHLCCKAADSGYRLIILMTGTLENLRRQTQERLDAGFVGLDSSGVLTQQRQNRLIGVGGIDGRRTAAVLTSRKTDFRSELVNSLGFRLSVFNEPTLVVIKKNKKILDNLVSWLRSYNLSPGSDQIDLPVLVIDDEADNASVNTTASSDDPTAINLRIRSLLRLFKKASYVGFTATPFANIFINPDTGNDMIGEDLFPKDFIYSLEPPSNYVGADMLFAQDEFDSCLRDIRDAEAIIPDRHKSDLVVSELPESLKAAVRSFVVCNSIRNLRGEGQTHRSMLVNVSRFTNVQDQVRKLIDYYLGEILQDIRNYSQLDVAEALKSAHISSLKDTFDTEYSGAGCNWGQVQKSLTRAALPIVVYSVNQRSGSASLDYSLHKDSGLRVIAVGGNSLSRGLTLEGLCVSYFYRNSQMYDTLMQMGRWFGYRDGYGDLCRIWMRSDAMQWYGHIAVATKELREEVGRMRSLGATPMEFGLKVRAHPDSLIVTARNKMRLSHSFDRMVSISGQGIETPRLSMNDATIEANARIVSTFLESLSAEQIPCSESNLGNPFWSGVHKEHVIGLLRQFNVHPLNMQFQPDALVSFLEKTDLPMLRDWDVVIPTGSGDNVELVGRLIATQKRSIELRLQDRSILVSGRRARVGSRGVEREGLSPEQIQMAVALATKNGVKGNSVPDKAYRQMRQRPLLLIHLLQAVLPDGDESQMKWLLRDRSVLVALGISFPVFDDSNESLRVRYTVNNILWDQILALADTDDDVEDLEDYSNV